MPEVADSSAPDISHETERANSQEPIGSTPHIRVLASPFKKSQLVMQEDGSLLIKGVPMLAVGTWTDSAVRTPLGYPEKTLSAYATNWEDNAGWSRHLGGVPRDITEKVAYGINQRYENGAVVADVVVHGATQKSRDTIELVKRKLISFVSVEHGGTETFNPQTRQMEASSLTFYGFAFVNKGACKLCRINEQPQEPRELTIRQEGGKWVIYSKEGKKLGEFDSEDAAKKRLQQIEYFKHKDREQAEPAPEHDRMDNKELEAAVAAAVAPLVKELEALKAQKSQEPAKTEIPKELAELPALVKELQAQIVELKKAPAAPVTTPQKERALEDSTPQFFVKVDRKAGIVG
jgi:hypothetical protein